MSINTCSGCGHALRSHKQKGKAKIFQCHYCDCKEFKPS